jgi:hypothetical protein
MNSEAFAVAGKMAPSGMLPRLGVASRLLLAFLGLSGLAMVGAAVAILSFREIGEVLDRVTARRVPAALASQEVSRQVERIIAAAPALLSAATPVEHAQRSRNIATEMGALDARLDKLEGGGSDSVSLGSMRLAVNRLWTNLKSIDRSVADRLVLSERKRNQLRDALAIQADTQALLTPWLQIVEGEIAQSRRAIADVAQKVEERAIAANRLLDSTEAYHALQRVQFLIASASDRLQQIATTDDADGLRVQVFRIQQALSEARQTAGNLDSRLRPLLLGMLDEFQKSAAGSGSIPELRQQELSIVALATRHLNDNSVLSTELTEAVDSLVSRTKRDISEANEDALSVQKFSATVLIAAVALSLISSILIVWLYVGRNIVSRLTALNRSMLAITEGNLQANVPTRGNDEIAEMGRVVEVLRQNTLERDELLVERAHTAERLEKQVEERTAELARSVEEWRVLGEVSQAVNSTLDLEVVLETIIAKAVQLSGADAGTIYVFDEPSQEFQVRASFGMPDDLVEALKQRHIKIGETMLSAVTMERRSMQVADTTNENSSLVLDVILRAGFRAFLTVPLLGADRTIGGLVVRRKKPGEFDKRIVDLLQTFAAQSVLAIDNARLFDEVQSRTRELAKSLKSLQSAQDRLVQTEKLAGSADRRHRARDQEPAQFRQQLFDGFGRAY